MPNNTKNHHQHTQHKAASLDHNQPPAQAVQWQTPHLPDDHDHNDTIDDNFKDLDLVEKAFIESFVIASDPPSFLRLAGVPFVGLDSTGTKLSLLRVEHNSTTDIGNLTPHLGGGSFRYSPLPTKMTSRRNTLNLVYHNGSTLVKLSLFEAKELNSV